MNDDLISWLGSLDTYAAVAYARAQVNTPKALDYIDEDENEDGDANPTTHRLMTVVDNVAIINVKGSMVSGRAGWMAYFGLCGYDDVREALTAAVYNAQVGSILFDVDTNGGDVKGVHELAQFVEKVGKVKPTYTYASGNMCSAGVWAFSGTKRLFASATSELGSIGILMIHKEVTKALAQEGVKVTVIRAGKHKAAGNPYEVLSEEAKNQMERRAQALYDVFLPLVAENRGVNVQVADNKFGQGVVFVGQEAVAAGLFDEIGTLEDAYAVASKAAKSRMQPRIPNQNGMGTTNMRSSSMAAGAQAGAVRHNSPSLENKSMKKPLTPEMLAALAAAGMSEEQIAAAAAAGDVEAGDNAGATKPQDTPAEPTKTEPVAESKTKVVDSSAMATLTGLLKDSQTEAAQLRVELAAAKSKAEASAQSAAGFIAIARQSVTAMGVMFGMSADSFAAMTENELLAQHGVLSEKVKAKYKAGGVTVPAVAADDKQAEKPAQLPVAFQLGLPTSSK